MYPFSASDAKVDGRFVLAVHAEQSAAVADNKEANEKLAAGGLEEVVADKGYYHSNEVLQDLAALKIRSYNSEPARGRRNWRQHERRCTGTGGGYEASEGSDYCGNAASGSNAASRTYTKRAACDEPIYEDTQTFSNGC